MRHFVETRRALKLLRLRLHWRFQEFTGENRRWRNWVRRAARMRLVRARWRRLYAEKLLIDVSALHLELLTSPFPRTATHDAASRLTSTITDLYAIALREVERLEKLYGEDWRKAPRPPAGPRPADSSSLRTNGPRSGADSGPAPSGDGPSAARREGERSESRPPRAARGGAAQPGPLGGCSGDRSGNDPFVLLCVFTIGFCAGALLAGGATTLAAELDDGGGWW